MPAGGPPSWNALSVLPVGKPPPSLLIMSLMGIPMGTSTRQGLFTLPDMEITLVPALFAVPIPAYQEAPRMMIGATLHQVSTLFKLVGPSHSPFSAVWMYLGRGSPALPSRVAISAVDSPQTYPPAPSFRVSEKVKPLPTMFSPSKPYS